MEIAAKLVSGNPSDEATEVGPLIRLSEAERVEAWVKEAVEGGAKLIAGGERKGSMVDADDSDRDQAGHEGSRRRGLWPGGGD